MERMEREIPANDRLNERLGVGRHYGSIEAAEEKRFPWLKARRRRYTTMTAQIIPFPKRPRSAR